MSLNQMVKCHACLCTCDGKGAPRGPGCGLLRARPSDPAGHRGPPLGGRLHGRRPCAAARREPPSHLEAPAGARGSRTVGADPRRSSATLRPQGEAALGSLLMDRPIPPVLGGRAGRDRQQSRDGDLNPMATNTTKTTANTTKTANTTRPASNSASAGNSSAKSTPKGALQSTQTLTL